MSGWIPKQHLAGRDPNHATLCNVKARRWEGKQLVRTEPVVVSLAEFKALTWSEGQCGRCFLALRAQEGTPVVRQR